MSQVAAGLLMVGLLILLGGFAGPCSDDENTGSRESPPPSPLISEQTIEDLEPNSPERAAVEWLRYVQYENPSGALRFYTDEAAPDEEELSRLLGITSTALAGLPDIQSVDRSGDDATVFMTLDPETDAPPRNISLNMAETGDGWKLADNSALEQEAASVARARAASAQRKAQQEQAEKEQAQKEQQQQPAVPEDIVSPQP